ncbi:hypothetical protein GWN63_02690 [Candidatus Bathyarchaeota archaeon]|nr:TldD/PmbA family protein [Candidatus Bathyarchaeota archaeon]NIU81137.1 hypothetical protein [Candidatus Bathyarchaeota archaeon]NIV67770.1 hypothetical protein [Candidatus Bathyarchaeota archaeon]NIW16403.1 hypothetical protein [Candidatus Bathyarchaeota archaeon]NIW34376.1 hypothetical protein [Candidatus Bathyarchaeota archaeon]
MSLENFAELATEKCKQLEADGAEAFAQHVRTTEVVLERGEIQNERSKRHEGIGIRVVKRKKLGFAFTSELSKHRISKTCQEAINLAEAAIPNPDWRSLPTPTKLPKVPGVFDPKLASLEASDVLDIASRAYDAVKDYDPRAFIDDGKFSLTVADTAVTNTLGVNASERSTLINGFLVCAAKETGAASSFTFEYDISRSMDFHPERIGEQAAKKAVGSLHAEKGRSFTGQVLLEQDPASRILFYPAFYSVNADQVQRGRSIWQGKIDDEVASSALTIIDDGTRPAGIGSSSFDDEGVPTKRTPIALGGVLKNYLYDSFTAQKEERESTGNARRENYQSLPEVAASNFVVKEGKKKIDDLISEVEHGILVGRFSGNVRPDSGEFSGIAKQAQLIEGGQLQNSLKGTMISGNAFEALHNIISIGVESRPTFQRIYTPPILVDKINIVAET